MPLCDITLLLIRHSYLNNFLPNHTLSKRVIADFNDLKVGLHEYNAAGSYLGMSFTHLTKLVRRSYVKSLVKRLRSIALSSNIVLYFNKVLVNLWKNSHSRKPYLSNLILTLCIKVHLSNLVLACLWENVLPRKSHRNNLMVHIRNRPLVCKPHLKKFMEILWRKALLGNLVWVRLWKNPSLPDK